MDTTYLQLCISKRILFVLLGFSFIGFCKSQRCSSPDMTEDELNKGYSNPDDLELSFSGVIKSFKMEHTTEINDTMNNKYINARLLDNTLEVFTTEDFGKYAEEQTGGLIFFQIILVCADRSRINLKFRQGIKNTNEHDPVFSKNLYEIKLPLPIYKGYNLTSCETFEENYISARDIDIYDNKVTFTATNSGIISVGTSPWIGSDEKTFYATVMLTEPLLSLTKPIEFTITATDSGNPPRSSSAQVRIFADQDVSLPIQPKFEKALYHGALNEIYNLIIEDAVITSDTFSEKIQFQIENDNCQLFKINVTNDRVQILLDREVTEEDLNYKMCFSFEIVASRPTVEDGRTAIVVLVPDRNAEYHFTKTLYNGTLDSSENLSIEDIQFDESTFTPDMKFRLKGPDARLFVVKNIANKIEISFSNEAQGEHLKNRQYLFIVLVALRDEEELTAAGVSISLPRSPKFEQALYRGSIDKQSNLYVDNILLEADPTSVITDLTLRGNYSEIFNLKQNENEIQLELERALTETEIHSNKFIALEIIAKNEQGVEGYTQVLLVFPTFLPIPQFVQALNKGSINSDGELVLDDVILRNSTYSEDIQYQLQGDGSEYFKLEINRNIVKIILDQPIPVFMIQDEKYLVLILVAANNDGNSGSTSILLDLLSASGPEFTKSVYKGALNATFALSIENISLKENTFEDGIVFSMTGSDSKYFELNSNKSNVMLELKSDLNPEELKDKAYLECYISARTTNGKTGSALVLVEVPNICDEQTTTCAPCPTTTPAPPCPTTTTSNPTPTSPSVGLPVFEKSTYAFRLNPEFIGNFGRILARVEDPNIQLIYTANITNDYLISRITLDQYLGQLAVTDLISPGSYSFEVFATNPVTNSKGRASVKLQVKAVNQCPGGVVVNKALLIKHIEEEYEYNDIFNASYGQCSYSVFSLEPNDKEYVFIDERTSMLSTIEIDREDPVFADMLVPQVQVELMLECRSFSRRKRDVDYRSLVLTEDIDYSTNFTILTLIIDDINDHSPEFVYPEKTVSMVGYPELAISHDLMPEHLIKVKAIDKDEGLNAKVQYRIKDNDYFGIDPVSGVIYPFANSDSSFDNTVLEVYAIDRNGEPDGRQTNLTIIVKLLQSQHLTLLSIKDRTSEELEDCLKDIQNKTNLEIFDIKHGVLPDNQKKTEQYSFRQSRTEGDHAIMLKTWVYAFDQYRELLDTSEIEDKLSSISNAPEITVVPYSSERQSGNYQSDTTGYIAGISVLVVLLVGVLASELLLWWYCVRPVSFKDVYNETSETVSSEGSMDHEMRYKTSADGYYDENYDTSQYKKRESMAITGSTMFESTDNSNASSYEALHEAENNGRIQNEKRKSQVTFNELVERIEIEIGHNNFKNNNDSDARL